jgi:hypothetical protein
MDTKIFKFDPTKHGFEPITKFPELRFNFTLTDNVFVKIITYDNFGDLVYWYKVITKLSGLTDDDRFNIYSGSYDFRQPSVYGIQCPPSLTYQGLITNDQFAESLIKHLCGTTKNNSINNDSIVRYNENLGPKMRLEYPSHYKNDN